MSKAEPALQWGGRFASAPDAALLAFGSSLEEDLVLAAFDVACSQAHVATLAASGVIDVGTAQALSSALRAIADEIPSGEFAAQARALGAEDVHGAIDARVRALGARGRRMAARRTQPQRSSRDDARALRARPGAARRGDIASGSRGSQLAAAKNALKDETVLAATTHWQPAQPILLAFWLGAVAEMFVRAARASSASRPTRVRPVRSVRAPAAARRFRSTGRSRRRNSISPRPRATRSTRSATATSRSTSCTR